MIPQIVIHLGNICFKCNFPQYSEILINHAHAKEIKF